MKGYSTGANPVHLLKHCMGPQGTTIQLTLVCPYSLPLFVLTRYSPRFSQTLPHKSPIFSSSSWSEDERSSPQPLTQHAKSQDLCRRHPPAMTSFLHSGRRILSTSHFQVSSTLIRGLSPPRSHLMTGACTSPSPGSSLWSGGGITLTVRVDLHYEALGPMGAPTAIPR